ncbi:hypothetical protein ABQE44_19230 [Mycolicibacterium sp. XJ2546]
MGVLLAVIVVAAVVVSGLLVMCWQGLGSDLFIHFAREHDVAAHRRCSHDPVED